MVTTWSSSTDFGVPVSGGAVGPSLSPTTIYVHGTLIRMKVVIIAPLADESTKAIAATDGRIEVEAAWDLFGVELVADWPPHTVDWYLPRRFRERHDSEEQRRRRDELLEQADVLCITFPYPTHLVRRAPRLRFVHQLPAGVSNLERGDLWHSSVPVTSGRGAGNSLPIAEWVIAAMLALAKEFPRAAAQRAGGYLDRTSFQSRQLANKTLGVIGLGGIGAHVARLGAALGMQVIGIRRSSQPVEHVEQMFPPARLYELLARSDVVVLSTQLTAETRHLLDAGAFAAMRRGAFVVNVARGELIDEAALFNALRTGHVGGFAADVYAGEFEHRPPAELLSLDQVILTPHTSGQTEQPSEGSLELFRDNLRRCLAGEPLANQVDWTRGY
jgi:D-2-hydroxyacid dehydrogenase (NADP+)